MPLAGTASAELLRQGGVGGSIEGGECGDPVQIDVLAGFYSDREGDAITMIVIL